MASDFRFPPPPGGQGFDPNPNTDPPTTSSSSLSLTSTSTPTSISSSTPLLVSGTVTVAADAVTTPSTLATTTGTSTSSSITFTRTNATIILGSAVGGIVLILIAFLSLWCWFKRRRRRRRAYVERGSSIAQRTTLTIEDPIDLPIDLYHTVETPSTVSSRWSRYSRFSFKASPDIQPPPSALGASKMLANHSVQAIIPIMIANHPYSRQSAYEQDLTEVKSEARMDIKRELQRNIQMGIKREVRREPEVKRERDSIFTTRAFSFSESVRSPVNMGSPRPSSTFTRRDPQELQDSNISPMQSNDTITLNTSNTSNTPALRLHVEEVVIPSSLSDEGSSLRSPASNNGNINNRFPFPLPPQNAADRVRMGLLRTLDVRKPVLVSDHRNLRASMTPEVVRNSNSTSASFITPAPTASSNSNLYPYIKQYQYPNPHLN